MKLAPIEKHQETSSCSKVIIFLLGNMLGKLLLLLLPLTPLLCTLLLLMCVWWKPQGPDSFIVHVETKCNPRVKCHLRLICGVNVSSLLWYHAPISVVQSGINRSIADGLGHNALCICHRVCWIQTQLFGYILKRDSRIRDANIA